MSSKARISVLGGGLVGHVIALDLATAYQVEVLDNDPDVLACLAATEKVSTQQVDFTDRDALQRAVQTADLVVGAVPGFMGFQTLKWVLETGKPVADISFFPEQAQELHALAVQHNTTAIVDIGVAPGMDNLILGYWSKRATVKHFECLVGGLPRNRVLPYEYKAPFSPSDVIEEYTRPGRYREHGKEIVKPALADPEMHHFAEIGHLEAFLTDGLRSLLESFPEIPDMVEKTLRYPGHREEMLRLRDGGFFSTEPVQVNGQAVIPLELTATLLKKHWRLELDEPEFTVMRVTVAGDKEQQPWKIVYDLFDERDATTGYSSMARTTGFTCAAAAHLLLTGKFSRKGVFPPELVGQEEGCFEFVLNYLKDRGVNYRQTES